MANRGSFAPDEWYHCYNRGVDKRIVFTCRGDYHRFLELLHLCNDTTALRRSDLSGKSTDELLTQSRTNRLVDIGAYCLMPNHFHLLLKNSTEHGITHFMRKLMTGYTMYFNKRHERTNNLFAKPFRSHHVDTDEYFQRVINYIHCNPAERMESKWKQGIVKDIASVKRKLIAYEYSSLANFAGQGLFQGIIDGSVFDVYQTIDPGEMIEEMMFYYQETNPSKTRKDEVTPRGEKSALILDS